MKTLTALSLLVIALCTSAFAGDGDQHISNTGAVFVRDDSHPAFGEAYRDPSGLIWGSLVVLSGNVQLISGAVANQYCTDLGGRLPKLEEFEQLDKYLGYGTPQGYSPLTADGSIEVLPGISEHWFWSSTLYDWDAAYVFMGDSGGIGFGYIDTDRTFARCVVK